MRTWVAGLCIALWGCSQKPGEPQVVRLFIWGEYISKDVLSEFEKKTGIRVEEIAYESDEQGLAKIKLPGTRYDLMVISNELLPAMVRENLVQPVDVPGTKNLDARFSAPAYTIAHKDGKRIAVPYMWGTVGICYDSDQVKLDDPSWKALWDEKHGGRIWMFDQMLQTLNVGLKVSGHSVNARDDRALEDAKQILLKQRPLVKYGNDQFKDEMKAGNILLGMAWNGDAVKIAQDKPSLKYVIPKEGGVIWVDNLVLLANAPNPQGAQKFLDFILQPDMAAKTSEYTYFASCVAEAKKHLPKEIAENKTVYPDDASLKNCEFREDPGQDIEKFRKIWDEVKGN